MAKKRTQKSILADQIADELLGLFFHQFKINGLTTQQKDFVLKSLVRCNMIAYDTPTDTWYHVTAYGGENEYGNPVKCTLTSGDGKTKAMRNLSYEPNPLGTYLIRLSPLGTYFEDVTDTVAEQLADIKVAIIQNTKAIKTPMIIGVTEKEDAETIKLACEDKEDGAPVIVVQDNIAKELTGVPTNVEYQGANLFNLYNEFRNDYLTRIGMLTRVDNPTERIQSAEVYAAINEAHDSVHSVIDYWNNQMEDYGLPYTMELVGCLDEVYTNALIVNANDGDGQEGRFER